MKNLKDMCVSVDLKQQAAELKEENVANLISVQDTDDSVTCVAGFFDYTPENILAFCDAVLVACLTSKKDLVFVDFTSMKQETPATLKALTGILVEQQLRKFKEDFNRAPRIAVWGSPPHISTYKPAQELLQGAGHQVAMFTEETQAWQWLFQYGSKPFPPPC